MPNLGLANPGLSNNQHPSHHEAKKLIEPCPSSLLGNAGHEAQHNKHERRHAQYKRHMTTTGGCARSNQHQKSAQTTRGTGACCLSGQQNGQPEGVKRTRESWKPGILSQPPPSSEACASPVLKSLSSHLGVLGERVELGFIREAERANLLMLSPKRLKRTRHKHVGAEQRWRSDKYGSSGKG